jgi:restriction endonuclease S subunit
MTEWPIINLGDLCTFITDGSHNPPKGVEYSIFHMLSSRDIQNGKLTFEKPRYLSAEDFAIENKRTDLQREDVLLTTVGTIGRTAIYDGIPKNVTFQRSVSVLRPNQRKITPKFLMYFLDSITEQLNREARGVAQQGIYLNQVRKLKVPVPPLSAQHKLVEILEDHLSRLDAALADVKQAKIKAAQFKRSLLHSIFSGQVEEFGCKSQWDDFVLNQVVQNLDNKRVPVNSAERSKRGGSIPYYGATGQVGTIDAAIFDDDLLLLGEDGVQFFDPSKPKAYLISGPSWVNNHVHVLKANNSFVNQRLLMHYLNQFNYLGYANGTTRLKLTQGAMNMIPISLPKRDIQERMLEYINQQLSIIEASVISADYVAAQSLSFKRALLQSAFTGQLANEVAIV